MHSVDIWSQVSVDEMLVATSLGIPPPITMPILQREKNWKSVHVIFPVTCSKCQRARLQTQVLFLSKIFIWKIF